ncbi:MAG: hypothetical protein LBI70_03650 [Rickettsiales bacterium]|jgi:hypothetical protein|nr:hypothetical protein [Rickettsiales bacterium]
MNKIKKYCCKDLSIVSYLFYGELLDDCDIVEIVDDLTNRGVDSDYLINILINKEDNLNYDVKGTFSSFLKSNNLQICSKNEAQRNVIRFIFEKIMDDNVDLRDGIGFIIKYMVNSGENGEYLGEHLGISEVICTYYSIDDVDIMDKISMKSAIADVMDCMRDYLEAKK